MICSQRNPPTPPRVGKQNTEINVKELYQHEQPKDVKRTLRRLLERASSSLFWPFQTSVHFIKSAGIRAHDLSHNHYTSDPTQVLNVLAE